MLARTENQRLPLTSMWHRTYQHTVTVRYATHACTCTCTCAGAQLPLPRLHLEEVQTPDARCQTPDWAFQTSGLDSPTPGFQCSRLSRDAMRCCRSRICAVLPMGCKSCGYLGTRCGLGNPSPARLVSRSPQSPSTLPFLPGLTTRPTSGCEVMLLWRGRMREKAVVHQGHNSWSVQVSCMCQPSSSLAIVNSIYKEPGSLIGSQSASQCGP